MKHLKTFEQYVNENKVNEDSITGGTNTGGEDNNYMFWQNLKTIDEAVDKMLNMNQDQVNKTLSDGHGWALDHIATSADDIDEVCHFLEGNANESKVNEASKTWISKFDDITDDINVLLNKLDDLKDEMRGEISTRQTTNYRNNLEDLFKAYNKMRRSLD